MRESFHIATVQQMLTYCIAAQGVLAELADDNFEYRRMHARALENALDLVSEAASQVPADIRQQYASVEWERAIALRNTSLQSDEHVDWQRAAEVVRNDLPPLVEKLQAILDSESSRGG